MRWLELLAAFIAGGLVHMFLEAYLLRRVQRREQQKNLSVSFGAIGGRSSAAHLDAKMRRDHGVGDGR